MLYTKNVNRYNDVIVKVEQQPTRHFQTFLKDTTESQQKMNLPSVTVKHQGPRLLEDILKE